MIKIIFSIIILLSSLPLFSQDTLTVESKVVKVVLFLKGAQVKRTAKCNLVKGINYLNLTKISSHVDERSVQVNCDSTVKVQSISFLVNYMDSLSRMQKIRELQFRKDFLDNEKLALENDIYVYNQEHELLKENQVLSGEKRITNTKEVSEACTYYHDRLLEILSLHKKTQNRIDAISAENVKIQNQLIELNNKKEKPVGEVWLVVHASDSGEKEIAIEYFISDAMWKPKYDIRAESVNKPAILSYKADVSQSTDEDWTNVELILSNSNPSLEGTKPVLKSWKINLKKKYTQRSITLERSNYTETSSYNNSVSYYENLKNDYSSPINVETNMTISGLVSDGTTGEPLPGVSILIEGSATGTITDLDGKYNLEVPAGSSYITFNFIGYKPEKIPVTGTIVNCYLELDDRGLDEVVVVGYGTAKKDQTLGASVVLVNDGYGNFVPGSIPSNSANYSGSYRSKRTRRDIKLLTWKKLTNKTIQGLNKVKESQTSVEFILDKPYTVPSDNKNYSVDIEKYEIPAQFQYTTVPKLESSAFLLAQFTGWEDLNLLSGKVNIYFEGTYVGNSELRVENISDTLSISMGRDKAIVIDRTLKKDMNKKQLLSKGKTDSYTWEITVRNTKGEKVNLIVEDQIPISNSKDFEVELLESQNAKIDKNKGELSWTLELEPFEKRTINFSYQIKSK